MPKTPDRQPGESDEEGIVWEERTSDPTDEYQTRFVQDKGLTIFQDGIARPIGVSNRLEPYQYPIIDKDLTAPPGGESAGDRYIVANPATGAWASHEGEIAQWNGTTWVFIVPIHGTVVYVQDEDEPYKQTETSPAWIWSKSAGTGINDDQHRTLRQLIHFIDDGPAEGFTSGAYKETTGTVFPTSIIWYESVSKLKKIVERTITWTGANPTTDEWEIYDTDGSTVLWRVTDAISYSGAFETTRTRTIAAGP